MTHAYAGEGHFMTVSAKFLLDVAVLLSVSDLVHIAGVLVGMFDGPSRYALCTETLVDAV